jgi:hypothetical protein
MNSAECGIEFLPHLLKRQRQRRAPSDQDIIVAGTHLAAGRKPYHFPQPAPHAVALHGIADLPRHRETNARRAILRASKRLQHEGLTGYPVAGRCGSKVRPARQPLHRNDGIGSPITH